MRYMIKKRRYRGGFTLIEMMVVIVSMTVLALAIYSTLSSGVKIWQRLGSEVSAEDVDIFFEKLTADLRSAVVYKAIDFSGEEDGFSLPALVASQRLNIKTVGKVEYSFDSGKKIVRRSVTDFSGISREESPTTIQEVLRDVTSLRFEYYVYDKALKQYLWQSGWSEKVPIAIKVELEMERDGKSVNFAQTVGIPIGN